MNDLSFKALNIVLNEEKNSYISEYITNLEYLKNIISAFKIWVVWGSLGSIGGSIGSMGSIPFRDFNDK